MFCTYLILIHTRFKIITFVFVQPWEPFEWTSIDVVSIKAGTHEGANSRSTLLQHAPGAKLPHLHQRFLAKKYVAQQNLCSRVLLPHVKLVRYEGASSRGKSVARVCFRSKLPRVYGWKLLPWHDVSPAGQSNWLVFLVPMPQSRCFIIQLPRRVLRVYWLGYLPGSEFLERVSGASSLCVPAFKVE